MDEPEQLPVDTEQWSRRSRCSLAANYLKTYRGQPYQCRRCGAVAVYSAADQKHDFEIRKIYVWSRRQHCASCFANLTAIEAKLRRYAWRWSMSQRQLRADKVFLARWLTLLDEAAALRGRPDAARMQMIKNLLAEG